MVAIHQNSKQIRIMAMPNVVFARSKSSNLDEIYGEEAKSSSKIFKYSVNFNNIFKDLKLRKTDLLGKKTEVKVRLEDIFSKKSGHHIILVTGEPGYGKTIVRKNI